MFEGNFVTDCVVQWPQLLLPSLILRLSFMQTKNKCKLGSEAKLWKSPQYSFEMLFVQSVDIGWKGQRMAECNEWTGR